MKLDKLLITLLVGMLVYFLWQAIDPSGRTQFVEILPFMNRRSSLGLNLSKLAMILVAGWAIVELMKGERQ